MSVSSGTITVDSMGRAANSSPPPSSVGRHDGDEATDALYAATGPAGGYGPRSGRDATEDCVSVWITVALERPESFEWLPLDAETALFRLVQESLINIHRRAASATACMRLQADAEAL